MSQQKQNNFLSEKLDELTALPGEASFNKDVIWQKLEGRIHQKRRSAKVIWFLAAACLFGVISVPLFIIKEKGHRAGNIVAAKNRTLVTRQQKDAIIITVPQHISTDMPARVTVKNLPYKKNTFIAKTIPPHSVLAKIPATIKEPPSVNLSPVPDVAVVAPASKKKLNVVHINELEDDDRLTSQTISNIRSVKLNNKKNVPVKEYAGVINFRIRLKN